MPLPHSPPSPTDSPRARLWLRRLAWLCAAMVLAITCLSAFVRLVNTGVGCTPWPGCYGQTGAPGADERHAGA